MKGAVTIALHSTVAQQNRVDRERVAA